MYLCCSNRFQLSRPRRMRRCTVPFGMMDAHTESCTEEVSSCKKLAAESYGSRSEKRSGFAEASSKTRGRASFEDARGKVGVLHADSSFGIYNIL